MTLWTPKTQNQCQRLCNCSRKNIRCYLKKAAILQCEEDISRKGWIRFIWERVVTPTRPSVFLEWSKPVKPISLGVFFSAPVSFDLSPYLPSAWSESLNKVAGFHCKYTCPNPECLFLSLSWHFQFFPVFNISLPNLSLKKLPLLSESAGDIVSISSAVSFYLRTWLSAISNCVSGLAPSCPQDSARVYTLHPQSFLQPSVDAPNTQVSYSWQHSHSHL